VSTSNQSGRIITIRPLAFSGWLKYRAQSTVHYAGPKTTRQMHNIVVVAASKFVVHNLINVFREYSAVG
jgi:hypothetical protein